MSSFSSPLRYRVPRLPRLSSRFTIDLLRSLVSKGIMPNKKKEEERKKRKGRNRFGANRLAREKITKRVYHPGRNPIKKARVCLVAREGFKDEGCVNEWRRPHVRFQRVYSTCIIPKTTVTTYNNLFIPFYYYYYYYCCCCCCCCCYYYYYYYYYYYIFIILIVLFIHLFIRLFIQF